jgi:glycosyltransferase involved in cell wall biosynthesis
MLSKKLSIFIFHPSDLITDCQPHGDGLIAFRFISHLAQRGHTLHVAVASMDIRGKLPENIKLYPAEVRTSSALLKRGEYMIKARQILNKIRRDCNIDLIHQLNPVFTGLSLSLIGTGLPVILGPFWSSWPSDAEATKFKSSLLEASSSFSKSFLKNVLLYQQQKQATALLVSTPAALSKLPKLESNTNKIYTLPPGIDSTLFSVDPNMSNGEKEVPTILFLANLELRKGIFTLLDAFESIVTTLPSCRLIIAGSGSKLEEVQRRILKMSCQSQILLAGKVERADVRRFMCQCTVYCLPSYGEPFGMSVLEAMACGKPVVGTNAGGLGYLIPDQGGRKVPPRDAQALADALLEILCSPELQVKMGQYNRSLVEKVYDWERVTEQLESIYYKLLASKN